MFDPSELTVKQARARLCELDIAGLEELLQAEIDGKHRTSLIADIGRNIDMIKTAEESEEAAEAEEALVEEAPVAESSEVIISEHKWFRMKRSSRRGWELLPDGNYRKR
tara:strand:- start:223 stop:549 length:327 start_codon:yes stop_codon:yes gene_type:complete